MKKHRIMMFMCPVCGRTYYATKGSIEISANYKMALWCLQCKKIRNMIQIEQNALSVLPALTGRANK